MLLSGRMITLGNSQRNHNNKNNNNNNNNATNSSNNNNNNEQFQPIPSTRINNEVVMAVNQSINDVIGAIGEDIMDS